MIGRERHIVTLLLILALGGVGLFLWQELVPAAQQTQSASLSAPVPTPSAPPSATIRLYFGNRLADPRGLNCSEVYPAERHVPVTLATPRAALELLLAGPTAAELERGFFSSLSPAVQIESLGVMDQVATVVLGGVVSGVRAGPCFVAATRAEVVETLRQFPGVSAVELSFTGGLGSGRRP